MRFRAFKVLLLCFAIGILSCVVTPPAWALVKIELSDLSYKDCPAELAKGTVSSGDVSAANCFLIIGKAINKSGKYIYNSDIFGRIYDANDNPVMQNRSRLGSIDEVPPGVSDFEIRITVSVDQPTPLKLKQFKASGFTGVVRR